VNAATARQTFAAIHRAIQGGLVRACHDLSEGGLAVAAAEMAFAGNLGAQVDVSRLNTDTNLDATARLYSESNTRFLCEVAPSKAPEFERELAGVPLAKIGEVRDEARLVVCDRDRELVNVEVSDLKRAWQTMAH
jgi:phosphoribosylformylglycinamidine synthase